MKLGPAADNQSGHFFNSVLVLLISLLGTEKWGLEYRLWEANCDRLEQQKRDGRKRDGGERLRFTAWTRESEGWGREGGHGLADWKKVVREGEGGGGGGGVAVSKGLELEQSRVQLSLWQERSTEGFIVICNYVVFCGASVWCAPTLRLFLVREYWVGEQREGGSGVTVNYFC